MSLFMVLNDPRTGKPGIVNSDPATRNAKLGSKLCKVFIIFFISFGLL